MSNQHKAIFLDRDGVINKNKDDYVKTVEELEIFPDIEIPLQKLKKANFLLVIITNQSAINRGLTSHEKIKDIHLKLEKYLEKNGVSIDKIYYCPHKPDEGCECRKPKPGLLYEAIKELQINPKLSWIIGDNESDIVAGKVIGCKTIKIDQNTNLEKAVEIILNSV